MCADQDLAEESGAVSAYPESGPEPWRPEIVEAIYGLLYRDDFGVDRLVAALREMEVRDGAVVYVERLHLLSHIRFEPDEAREHWNAIVHHREDRPDRVIKWAGWQRYSIK